VDTNPGGPGCVDASRTLSGVGRQEWHIEPTTGFARPLSAECAQLQAACRLANQRGTSEPFGGPIRARAEPTTCADTTGGSPVHTLAGLGASRNDPFMAEPGEQDRLPSEEPNGGPPGGDREDRPGEAVAPPAAMTGRRQSRWMWVSAVLAIAAAGLGIWALTLRSDRDDSQQELDTTTQQLTSTEQQLDTTKQQLTTAEQDVEDLQSSNGSERKGAGLALVTAKVLYDEFAEQLGTTNDELAATQQDVEDANKAAAQAEKDAAAAKQDAADAGDASGKAEAEAKQAKAETQAAESKAKAAKGCAKAYIEAFGGLFEGDSASARAEAVRKDLKAVTLDCKDALAGT
jgi:hypothetical protein